MSKPYPMRLVKVGARTNRLLAVRKGLGAPPVPRINTVTGNQDIMFSLYDPETSEEYQLIGTPKAWARMVKQMLKLLEGNL